MSWAWPALLGTLQGLTEFLPISSSGHMVALGLLFGVRTQGLALEASLHLGTLLAVLWVYRDDLRPFASLPWDVPTRRAARAMGLALGATGAVALAIRTLDARAARDPRLVAAGFLATTALLLLSRCVRPGRRLLPSDLGSLLVGILQGTATFPGFSRSAATIVAGLLTGLSPEASARFSFLLSVPTILGAVFLTLLEGGYRSWAATPWMLGIAVSAAFGALSIRWVQGSLGEGRLWGFAAYTAGMALVLLLLA